MKSLTIHVTSNLETVASMPTLETSVPRHGKAFTHFQYFLKTLETSVPRHGKAFTHFQYYLKIFHIEVPTIRSLSILLILSFSITSFQFFFSFSPYSLHKLVLRIANKGLIHEFWDFDSQIRHIFRVLSPTPNLTLGDSICSSPPNFFEELQMRN